jgi:hypothetical protein
VHEPESEAGGAAPWVPEPSSDVRFPPDPATSAARVYRRKRDRRRVPYRVAALAYIFLVVMTFSIYYGQSAFAPSPPPSSGGGGSSSGGAPRNTHYITFGDPTVHDTTCGDGTVFPTETVPWVGSRVALTTHDIFLEVVELLDGDVTGGPTPTPSVNATSVCAGAPPTSSPTWYVVLQNPSGANVAYFSYSQGWAILDPPYTPVTIANGSALVLVPFPQLAGTSFGICVLAVVGTASIGDCAQL